MPDTTKLCWPVFVFNINESPVRILFRKANGSDITTDLPILKVFQMFSGSPDLNLLGRLNVLKVVSIDTTCTGPFGDLTRALRNVSM